MMQRQKEFAQSYVCSKCRGTKADVREVTLVKSVFLDMFSSKDNRYLEVTCVLCGYTEFYNRALYLAAHAREVGNEKALVLPKNPDRS